MIRAAHSYPEAVAVSCRCDSYLHGRKIRSFARGARPLIEAVDPERVHLAMYMLEDVRGAQPSLQLVSRDVVQKGVLFEQVGGTGVLVDSCWNARVRSKGLALILNSSLVDCHQGDHTTVTSAAGPDSLDDEHIRFRRFVASFIPPSLQKPRLEA